MHLRKEKKKGRLLSIEEEFCNHVLAFSFAYCLHIHNSSKQVVARISKLGVAKGVVNIFPTTHLPCLMSLDGSSAVQLGRIKVFAKKIHLCLIYSQNARAE